MSLNIATEEVPVMVPEYDWAFVQDTIDLFQRKKVAAYGGYRYSDPKHPGDIVRGAEIWSQCVRSDDYYLRRCDVNAISQAAAVAPAMIKGCVTPIFLGPGDLFRQKEFKLADQFSSIGGCIVDDMSRDFAESARNDAVLHFGLFKKTQAVALTNNFFTDDLFGNQFVKNHPNFKFIGTPVMIITGLTAYNVEGALEDVRSSLVSRLSKLRQDLIRAYKLSTDQMGKKPQEKPHLILSHDFTADKKVINIAYKGLARFSKNVAHRMVRDTTISSGFRPDKINSQYTYHADHRVVTVDLVAKKDMLFSITPEFSNKKVPFNLTKGERFTISNCYKPSIEENWKIVAEAGFKPKAVVTEADQRVGVHFLEVILD